MPRPLRYAALVFAIAVSATCGDKDPLGVEANHPPIVDAIQLTIDEDSSGVADVLATARDVDGDSLRLTLWGQGRHGSVAASGGGLRYTPSPNYNGPDAFVFTVADGNGGEAQDSVRVTVLPVNDAPVAADDSARGDEDARLDVDVLANDTDVDGDSLFIVVAEDGAHGASLTDGSVLSYVPESNFNGTDTLRYVIADSAGARDSARVVVTIVAVNDPPVVVDDSASVNEDDSVTVDVLANDSDPDGDSLAIASFTQPASGVVTQVGSALRYVPKPDFNGTDSIGYTVQDGNGGETAGTVYVTVVPVPDAPVAVADTASVAEDSTVLIDVLANDTDADGDALAVASVADPSHGQAAVQAGAIRYTPVANYNGTDAFTYVVSDGNGGADTAAVTVTVLAENDAPVAVADSGTVAEDGALFIDVLANDFDADGDSLVISAFTQPGHGAVTAEGAGLRYSPSANYNGPDAFTYTVDDGHGGTATGSVSVTVTAVNDAPVAADDSASTIEETSVLVDVLANDSDVDGDALLLSGYTAPSNGSVSQEGNALRYTPATYFNGTDSLRYVVSDGAAADTGTVRIHVSSVNDPPVARDDSATVAEDSTVLITVLANDSDPDDTILNVAGVTQPAHGTVAQEGDRFRYTPAPDYNGLDSFTYQVSDSALADTATVFLTIMPVNDAPTAGSFGITTVEDVPVPVSPLDHAQDVDGDSLVLSGFSQPAHGTTSADSTGVLYTPAANFNGTDGFTYEVSDGHGGTASGSVSVTVQAVNDAPVAVADAATLDEDSTVLIAVLANDTDPDGDSLAVSGFTQGAHGVVTQEGSSLRYTPEANYNGADSFQYVADDGQGGADTANVTLTVTPVNDPPVAANDVATLDEDSNVLVDVLANDTDPDGDSLSLSGFTQGAHGAVTQEGNSLRYTPAARYNGSDAFTYTVDDGHGGADTATVNLTINSVNYPPVTLPDTATLNEDSTVLIDVLANDSDPDGDPLSVSGFTQGAHGTVTLEGNSLRYTPEANYNGSDSFQYFADDGGGLPSAGTVYMTVLPVSDPPVAVDDAVTLNEDTNVLVNVLANDSDPDGDALTVSAFTQGSHGTVTQEGDSLRYAPAADYNGPDTLSYTISDGNGGTATASVSVTVSPVNDPPVAVDYNATVVDGSQATFSVLADATDVDGDRLSLASYGGASHGQLGYIFSGGQVTALYYVPNRPYTGPDQFQYTVSDGHGGTSTGNVTVNVVAGALTTITVTPDSATVAASGQQQFTASGSDVWGNAVAISPAWSVVNGGGTITSGGLFTAGTSPGTFTNTVRATSGGVSGLATVVISP